MSRRRYRLVRRNWSLVVAYWLEVLWSCRCSYDNVATGRCVFCGARPPRSIVEVLAGVPLPPRRDLASDWIGLE